MVRTRSVRIVVVALLALGGGAALWYARDRSPSAAAAPGRLPELSPAERLTALDNSLRAISDGVRDAPRDRWDPAYVAEHVGADPEVLRKWVQVNTRWIPYRGVLRGPVGVLMDRQGNSLDRALLLVRLLAQSGHSARLARAELPLERAMRLLPELGARQAVGIVDPASGEGAAAPIRDVASAYQLNGAAIEQQMAAYEAGTARLLADLDQRVSEQSARLLSTVSPPDPRAEWLTRRDTALAALRDHWWVQVRSRESWIDLDVLEADTAGGSTTPLAPVETLTSAEVVPSLFHEIGISVVEERVIDGTLAERRTLERTIRPSDLVGQPVVLQFWPAAWQNSSTPDPDDSGRTFRKVALEQEEWNAGLVISGDVVARGSLPAAGRSKARAPGLGGLGGAISRGLSPQTQSNDAEQDSLLTAVRIEYQVNVPGRKPRTIRRTVFDLIGPAARENWPAGRKLALNEKQRTTRALSLMMQTEILPVVAQLAPEYVVYLGGRNLLANRDLLRAVTTAGFGSDQNAADSLLRKGQQGASPLHTLAILRQDALGAAGFIDRPVILTRHVFPTAETQNLELMGATDIVANEAGVSLAVSDGFGARLTQGVWDTNLEALLAGSRASGNTALAYARAGDWRVFSASHFERGASGLPADAAALLHQDLERGYTVVAPNAPVARDGKEFVGWWRIDPETGDALGIAGNGWGQAPDYAMHIGAFVEMAKPFVFAYALCQFIPQAANSLNILGNEFWELGIRPKGTTRAAEGKDFVDVAAENNRRCVIEAILMGFVASAPLLLRTLAYRAEAELAIERRMVSNRPFTKLSNERPTGVNPRPQGYPAPSEPAASGRGPGGTLPAGGQPTIKPSGKTQPGLGNPPPPASPGKTQPGLGNPPAPAPTPLATAKGNLKAAEEAYDEVQRASFETTRDFIRYRNNRLDPNASWDPKVDAELQQKAWDMEQLEIRAVNQL
jgi:hypothetical protein